MQALECCNGGHRRLWWIGGTPTVDQVGRSGDELLDSMLFRCAAACASVADAMSGHAPRLDHAERSARLGWVDRNRDEARLYPLEPLLVREDEPEENYCVTTVISPIPVE